MCEATIKELCYLLSIDLGVRISYTIDCIFPRLNDGCSAFIVVNGKVHNLSWGLDDDIGDANIVNSPDFNILKEESIKIIVKIIYNDT